MTGDMHCGFDKGFSFGGVYEIRYQMELKGDTVLLVDDGDAVQGAPVGYLSRGEFMINLMNEMGYDVAIPGEHEFEYGMDRFFEFVQNSNHEYICCNLEKDGKQVLKPYVIKEVCGKKIAFVGVTTPKTMGYYTSEAIFKDLNNKTIYSFKGGSKNKKLFAAVQAYANYARNAGADYVFLMSHFGQAKKYNDWDEITTLVANIKGIDAVFDGHSHDAKKLELTDAEGKTIAKGNDVSRLALEIIVDSQIEQLFA